GVVGFIEKDRLLVAAFAHQVVRVTREQKAILAGHNSPFAVAVGFVFLGAYPLRASRMKGISPQFATKIKRPYGPLNCSIVIRQLQKSNALISVLCVPFLHVSMPRGSTNLFNLSGLCANRNFCCRARKMALFLAF
ncbi:MAG: hypothetical protein JKY64_02330, partial [Alcanivorax sp.]|nr:hypothetical protein [Alcanivorax sp.]